jgi:MOSC domain-containing protein YiiM
MHVVSVQIGSARTLDLGSRNVATGIHKSPVDEITLQPEGVVGDAVVNTKHHGGLDQAVYGYAADDYAWWELELGRSAEPGTFGENLTISDAPGVVRAGDRLRIGPALLEVTAPRIPCATFAARMGEPGWIRRFRDAERPGFYCRVLEPGIIGPGDRVGWSAAPPENVSLAEMVEDVYASDLPEARVRRALASPIAERARAEYRSQLQ